MSYYNADTLYKQHKVFGLVNAQKLNIWITFCVGIPMFMCGIWLGFVITTSVVFKMSVGNPTFNGYCLIFATIAWGIMQILIIWEAWLKRRYRKVAAVLNALEGVNGSI